MLVDEEERRYFKQQEITLWRKGERVRKLPLANRSNSCCFLSSRNLTLQPLPTAACPGKTRSRGPAYRGGGKSSIKTCYLRTNLIIKLACTQVRTAPTPSQPPTPFAEGGKPLPGEVEEIKEEGEQLPEEKAPAPEDQLCEETKEKLVVSEKVEVSSSTKEESVTEEAQGPVPDLVPQGDQQQDNGGETDSLKVSVCSCVGYKS